jgi:hypothetical protein
LFSGVHRLSIPPPTILAHDSPSLSPLVDLDEYMKCIHTPDGRDCYPDLDDDGDNPSLSRRGAGAGVFINSCLSILGYPAPEATTFGATSSP